MRSLPGRFAGIPCGRLCRPLLAAFVAVVALRQPGVAGTITWGSGQQITGDSDVVTTGSFVYAYNFGAETAATTTVNGVPFDAFEILTVPITTVTVGNVTLTESPAYLWPYAGFGGSANPYASLSPSYKTLLNTAIYASFPGTITVTLAGLQNGQQYLVQWWANDSTLTYGSLTTATSGNSVTLDPNTTNLAGGLGQFATGTFTATGGSQTFTLTGQDGGLGPDFPMISALQLRTAAGPGPTPVPEIDGGSAAAAAALLAAAFAAVERRRRGAASRATGRIG